MGYRTTSWRGTNHARQFQIQEFGLLAKIDYVIEKVQNLINNLFSLAVLRNDLEESFSVGKISKLSTQILNLAGTIIAVIVDSLCDPISLVRSVSLAYSALNP